jgi:hypothetical protein
VYTRSQQGGLALVTTWSHCLPSMLDSYSQLTAWIHIHHAVYFVSNYSLGILLKLKQRSDSSIRHPLHAHMRRSSAGMNDTPMSLLPESQLTYKLGKNKRNTTY